MPGGFPLAIPIPDFKNEMSRGLLSSGAKRPLLDILRLDPPRFDCALVAGSWWLVVGSRIPFSARHAPRFAVGGGAPRAGGLRMCAKSCGASFVNQLQIVRCRMVNHLHFMSVGKTRMGGLVREGPRDGGGPQARKSPLA